MTEETFDWDRTIVEPIVQFDRACIDPVLGVTVAVAVAVPVALALFTPWTASAVMVALAAFNLFIGAGGLPSRSRARSTGLALGLNAAALAGGTAAGTLGGFALLVVVAVGIAALSSARLLPFGRWAGVSSAALFAIGVGLPGETVTLATDRVGLALIGGLWAIAIGATVAWLRRPSSRPRATPSPPAVAASPARSVALAASVTGVAAAFAFGVGGLLGLPRDYWTILTVVVVFQTGILAAISNSMVRIVGTLVGAILGGALAAVVTGPVALAVLIGGLAGGTMALRPASPSIYVALLTPFVIVLLSISYPSSWALAGGRVADTLVGSACALAATAVLWLATRLDRFAGRPSRAGGS